VIVNNLFPTAVVKFELGRNFSNDEMTFISNQSTYKNKGNTTSNNRYVLRQEEMNSLNTFVEKSVSEYLYAICSAKNEVQLRITQSWLNYCKPGEWHHKHKHPNSLISGVLYIKASKERDKIYFYRDDFQQIKLPVENWNLYNSESWWLEVNTGDLLLFPSHLSHMVETVREDDRVSLAFNTFPMGNLGDESELTALRLEH